MDKVPLGKRDLPALAARPAHVFFQDGLGGAGSIALGGLGRLLPGRPTLQIFFFFWRVLGGIDDLHDRAARRDAVAVDR